MTAGRDSSGSAPPGRTHAHKGRAQEPAPGLNRGGREVGAGVPAANDPRHQNGEVVLFRPEEARAREDQIEAAVALAKKLKDWEALTVAVAAMIEHQTKVVSWWSEKVTGNRYNINPPENADRGFLSVDQAEHLTGLAQQKISKWRQRLADIDAYQEFLRGPSYRTAMGESLGTVRGTQGTGEFERYTPACYLDAARAVLGTIDLDPASSEVAQRTVKARKFFTVEDDGLQQQWHGRIWLNPPYHRELAPLFIEKLLLELDCGNVAAAIMLTNNSTDTEWFRAAADACSAICFTDGRIKFQTRLGEPLLPTQGQAFFYFGDMLSTFYSFFRDIGIIMTVCRMGGQ